MVGVVVVTEPTVQPVVFSGVLQSTGGNKKEDAGLGVGVGAFAICAEARDDNATTAGSNHPKIGRSKVDDMMNPNWCSRVAVDPAATRE